MSRKKWIALDAAGTLFETAQPVEAVYSACFSKLGFTAPEATWKTAFRETFSTTSDPSYPKHGNGEDIEKDWWRELVRRSASAAGIHPDPETMEQVFNELFDYYAEGTSWKLFPETESTLEALRSTDTRLAITSNFDSRIHRVLKELRITHHFDHILTSADVRARKPSPLILEKLLNITSSSPSDCCLAGDSITADKGAAEAVGMPFYHIHRPDRSLTEFVEWHQAAR